MATTESAVTAAPSVATGTKQRAERSLWWDAWRRFRRHRLAIVGALIYGVLILMTLVGPLLWTRGINDIDLLASGQFSTAHPLGADDLGRDVLARILWGGRISIAVGFAAMLVAVTIGVLVGAIAGFFGGWIDTLLSRFIEVFLSVPQLPLLLV